MIIYYSNADENWSISYFLLKTVGYVFGPDRMVHQWVSEMMLNVHSKSLKHELFLN